MRNWKVTLGSVVTVLDGRSDVMADVAALVEKHGGVPALVPTDEPTEAQKSEQKSAARAMVVAAAPVVDRAVVATLPVQTTRPVYSTFGQGGQIVDDGAKTRIEAEHAALRSAGVAVNPREQLYATGTRMAKVGYETQAARKRAHDNLRDARDAAADLAREVEAEKRTDRTVSAFEFSKNLAVNGKITAFGLTLSETAIRALLARIEAPGAVSYVMGLRDRVGTLLEAAAKVSAERASLLDLARADKARIAEILSYECARAGDVTLTLRTREALGDIFAVVSPKYAPCDAPEVLAKVLDELPYQAKGTYAYDPESTSWEFRTDVWTPTPVDQQAVGEAFRGYVSLRSKDNGAGSFGGGGGVEFLRCLNASTYMVENKTGKRRHLGRAMWDIDALVRESCRAATALCKAWGQVRDLELALPVDAKDRTVSIQEAIPGFYRYLLTDRRSPLAQILPGRSEKHLQPLARAWKDERRDTTRLVRSDLAQGWTRYIQDQDDETRREGEAAIGEWLVKGAPVQYVSADA